MVDMAPNAAISQLRSLCGAIGAQVPLWTQGAGGNVSVKAAGKLYIKASGERLDGVGGPTTYAALPVAPLRAQVAQLAGQLAVKGRTPTAEALYAAALTEHRDPALGRPSMESGMHALLPGQYVAHFHALSAVLMGHHELLQPGYVRALCAAQGVLADFVPATLPGLQLSCALVPLARAQVLVLGNHGVVLQGDDPEALLPMWRSIEVAFCAAAGYGLLAEYLSGRASVPRTLAMPHRLYFPDTAVFADRLVNVLEAVANVDDSTTGPTAYTLAPHAWRDDRNTAELWWAQCVLYALCPKLAELPDDQAAAVAGLPTELWRRQTVMPSALRASEEA